MDSYRDIDAYAKTLGLTYVVFNRDGNSFCSVLHNEFTDLTNQYEEYCGAYEPFYKDIVSISIDCQLLDSSLISKKIKFSIKSVCAKDFKYISHIAKCEGNDFPKIYDVVFGPSLQLIKQLYEYLKNKLKPTTCKGQIYVWNAAYGTYFRDNKSYYDKSIDDLFGLNNHYENIMTDIQKYTKHKDLLIKLGESNGLNYMLYGPPGTGKSSFVRAIADKLELPIFIAKLTMASNENQMTDMLIPNSTTIKQYCSNKFNNDKFHIVLIEDFDRYLDLDKKVSMSAILNALDGVFPAFNVIRFFSANNPKSININGALTSRMNRIMYFDYPNQEQIKSLICNAYGDKTDKDLLYILANQLNELEVSMRQITHYVCQYLDNDNPVESLIKNLDLWIENMNQFNDYKVLFDKK